ncbi:MAG: hypothetical protein AUJ52_06515 [Elusimicrobia bacterium CG1_02_63_36]|nr:MAG: hypothetical protein AUJ52_06515 [Elusimicrobia bacterium CG1_02_63_36]
MIYKLLLPGEWTAFQGSAVFTGSPVDRADGFIHFSTAEQLRETARKHFAEESGLVLLEIDPARLSGALKWEPSRGGALFPHLYAELPLQAVTRHWTLLRGAGGELIPENLI